MKVESEKVKVESRNLKVKKEVGSGPPALPMQ
jgi:hypothetical protein